MAPGIMHILLVHSDGFVIKEFHILFPSIVGVRERRNKWGFQGRLRTIPNRVRSLHLKEKNSREGNPRTHADAHPCV